MKKKRCLDVNIELFLLLLFTFEIIWTRIILNNWDYEMIPIFLNTLYISKDVNISKYLISI